VLTLRRGEIAGPARGFVLGCGQRRRQSVPVAGGESEDDVDQDDDIQVKP